MPDRYAGPGLAAGVRHDTLVELIDLNPTLCAWAGLDPQPDLDARDLTPVLSGAATTHRDNIVSVLRPFWCLRTPTHKLIQYAHGPRELFALVEDPDERVDLSQRDPDLANHLARRLTQRCVKERAWRY